MCKQRRYFFTDTLKGNITLHSLCCSGICVQNALRESYSCLVLVKSVCRVHHSTPPLSPKIIDFMLSFFTLIGEVQCLIKVVYVNCH